MTSENLKFHFMLNPSHSDIFCYNSPSNRATYHSSTQCSEHQYRPLVQQNTDTKMVIKQQSAIGQEEEIVPGKDDTVCNTGNLGMK